LKEGLEIHLVPSIQYLVSLDDEERRPVQYPTLAAGGKTEMIAEMSHSDLPSNCDPIALGDHVLNFDVKVRESSAETTMDGLECIRTGETGSLNPKRSALIQGTAATRCFRNYYPMGQERFPASFWMRPRRPRR
jgi:hypothetical protein